MIEIVKDIKVHRCAMLDDIYRERAAKEPNTLLGWKDDFNESDWCHRRKENQTREECIEEHTFKRHDAIKDVLWGYDPVKSIMSNDLVHEDFTLAGHGKFFFVNVSKTMIPTSSAA